jgi:large subunit ribosomal protein L3
MMNSLWGKKVGMTQLFAADKVVPVTAVDVSNWVLTGLKTKERDGYNAAQVGCLRKRYAQKEFSKDWLKQLTTYFGHIKEVKLGEVVPELVLGQKVNFETMFEQGQKVHATGISKGCGFAGTMKRHNFNGMPATHGCTMGKRPGSLSFMRTRGRVIKGKRLPGHMGTLQRVMKNLEIIKVDRDAQLVFVKGSLPGKAGSLVCVRKA